MKARWVLLVVCLAACGGTLPMDTKTDVVLEATDSAAPDSQCVPDCSGKECGDDGCGGSCGNCPDGFSCAPVGTYWDQSTCNPSGFPGPTYTWSIVAFGVGGHPGEALDLDENPATCSPMEGGGGRWVGETGSAACSAKTHPGCVGAGEGAEIAVRQGVRVVDEAVFETPTQREKVGFDSRVYSPRSACRRRASSCSGAGPGTRGTAWP